MSSHVGSQSVAVSRMSSEPSRHIFVHLYCSPEISTRAASAHSCRTNNTQCSLRQEKLDGRDVLFCSLDVLDPRVGHTTDVLPPFISLLCHSD